MDLLKAIKKAALDAVRASKPVDVVYGKVTGTNPIKVQIDQKLILSKAQLAITENLATAGLNIGDSVIMIQAAGGQQYVIIDRIGVIT